MSELFDLLARLLTCLNQANLRYVIVGGVAAILRGRVRTTTDVNLIIENDEKKFWTFLSELKNAQFDYSSEQAKYSLKEHFNCSIFDNNSMMRIDLKLAWSKFDLETLNTAVLEIFNGISLNLASVEQLLIGKAIYLGDISGEADSELFEFNDVLDFITVYRIFKEKIHLSKLLESIKSPKTRTTFKRLIKLSDTY